jgi:predicted RNA-binding protein with PIN domain
MKVKTYYHSCRLQVVFDPADINTIEETENLYFLVVYLAGHTTDGLMDWACQSISGMSAQLMT